MILKEKNAKDTKVFILPKFLTINIKYRKKVIYYIYIYYIYLLHIFIYINNYFLLKK